jgi:RNA polymerase sigma-B factor
VSATAEEVPLAARRPSPELPPHVLAGRRRTRHGADPAALALLRRYHATRDPRLLDLLGERFLTLARQIARRHQRPGEPLDDILQVACLALVTCLERFDPDRGVAFSSYAVPSIVGEIKRHYRDRTWAVRVPRDLQELALRVERTADALAGDLGRPASVGRIAERLEVGEEDVLEALQAADAHRADSLEAPRAGIADGESGTLGDTVGERDDGFTAAERRADLDRLIAGLSAQERDVVRLRFREDLTQAQIGRRIGVSQMQVSRLQR